MSEKKFTPGPQAWRVLAAIGMCERRHWLPPTSREIAFYCKEGRRASDWAHGKLKTLERHGLIEVAGSSGLSSAATWKLTEAGAALFSARGEA